MSPADVDAGEMADVRVSHCSAYDPNDCGADGCTCEKTRDGRLASYSRWSCAPDLIMKPCEMCYSFDPPQVQRCSTVPSLYLVVNAEDSNTSGHNWLSIENDVSDLDTIHIADNTCEGKNMNSAGND